MDVCYSHPRGSPMKPQLTLQWLREPAEVGQDEADALALTFSQHGCASSRLVGGKGCQLALLTQLKSDVRPCSRFYLTLDYCVHRSCCILQPTGSLCVTIEINIYVITVFEII